MYHTSGTDFLALYRGFLDANKAGILWPLVDALRQQQVAYVGPKHLQELIRCWTGIEKYVVVPRQNCYLSKDQILGFVRQRIAQGADVVGFSAGMLSNVLIDNLWQEFNGRITLIDFGSIFDPYASIISRSYMEEKVHNWQKLKQMNFEHVVE